MQTIFQAALQCEIKSQLGRMHPLSFLDSGTTVNHIVLLHTSNISEVLSKTKNQTKTNNPLQTNKQTHQKTKNPQPKIKKPHTHTISTMCNSSKCKIFDEWKISPAFCATHLHCHRIKKIK